ncbi:MAG TPA: nickel-binding protein [Acidimicrobiia bacterium]|jgi:class 3 adenylate cyclase
MFMDRHDAVTATAEQLADAHSLDLEAEKRYGVHYHTYWFDPDRRSVFCLVEGPDKDAVEAVHRDSHGLVADALVEVDPNVPLNSLMGPLPAHPPGEAYTAPAMRAIVFTDICGSVAQTAQLGDKGHLALLRDHNEVVRAELSSQGGREVKHTGDGIMASFTSVSSAVGFAIAVQAALNDRNEREAIPLHVSIGISAGEPVTDDHDDLFGAAVQLAARLCDAAEPGDIAVSVAVRELCIGKQFRFEDRGAVPLKGMPEPISMYAVAWRD